MYLGLQVIGVFVIEPNLSIVTVGDAVGGHPVLLVSSTLGHYPRDQGGWAQVQLQPLMI